MFMAVGDFHLGCLSDYAPTLYKKQLKTLRKVLDYAVSHDIGHVFLMGDIFDSPYPDNKLIISLRKLLYSYRDSLHFHIVIGNHDWESTEHHALQIIYDLGSTGLFNFTVYEEPKVIKIEGVKIFVCSHPNIMDPPVKVDWCLGHFGWNGAKGDNGYVIKNDNQPKGRWILGDYHTHQSGNRYVYVGALTQITWQEGAKKGIILFDKDEWNWKVITPEYELGVAEIETENDLDKLDDKKLWSLRTSNGYTIPPDFKSSHPNIIHIAPSRKRNDERAEILTESDTSVLFNPVKKLKPFLAKSKLSLSDKEMKYAVSFVKKRMANITIR